MLRLLRWRTIREVLAPLFFLFLFFSLCVPLSVSLSISTIRDALLEKDMKAGCQVVIYGYMDTRALI